MFRISQANLHQKLIQQVSNEPVQFDYGNIGFIEILNNFGNY